MTAVGQLRIIPTYDLRTLGPGAGEPLLYDWHWYYSAPLAALWAMLLLAMVVPKANRTRGVLLILVPVLLADASWFILASTFGGPASDKEMFRVMALSLAVGSGVLWLVGHVLAKTTGRRAFVLASGIALGVALAGVLSFLDSSASTILFASLLVVVMLTVVSAYALAAWMSRGRYRPLRFILLLAAGIVTLTTTGWLAAFVVWLATTGNWPSRTGSAWEDAAAMGLVFGGYVFLMSLVFLLTGLRSPLFRPRLFACLRLPAPANPSGLATAVP